MRFWLIVGFCSAAVFAAAVAPAAAADTGYFSIVGSSNVYGCPATVKFTGHIDGPAGSAVTYQFARYVGSTGWQYFPQPPTTIPAGGSLPIQSQLNVTSANAGFQSYELQISQPQGSDVSHAKQYFTVTCLSIVPHLNLGGSGPTGLKPSTDISDCYNHAPQIVCGFIFADALPSKSLVLEWNYGDPADGYNVYRVDGRQHLKVGGQTNGNFKVSEILKPAGGSYEGTCYAVAAYKGRTESSLSQPYCFSALVGLGHIILTRARWGSHYHEYRESGPFATLESEGLPACGDRIMCVGWVHRATDVGPIHSSTVNFVFRTYVAFDRGSVRGLSISSALLKLRVADGNPTCVDKISAANSDWLDFNNWANAFVDGDFPNGVGIQRASRTGIIVDVTNIVRKWANGSPNYGFVITGHNEDQGAHEDSQCLLSLYSNAVLDIGL